MVQEDSENFAIYVVQHKPSQVLTDPKFVPICVGPNSSGLAQAEAICSGHAMASDATGENIAVKNDSYCELTAFYWAWKNAPATDYIGFMHYRRHLNFSSADAGVDSKWGVVEYDSIDRDYEQTNGLASEQVSALLRSYDVLLPRKWNVENGGAKDLYGHWQAGPDHVPGDYDKVLKILLEMHPEYARYVKQVNSSTHGYFTNMFVMSRKLFDEYCGWLFPILVRLESSLDTSQYSRQQKRVYGFLSEWLFNIFMAKVIAERPDLKVKELQRTFVRHTEPSRAIEPAFGGEAVPIVLSFNDKFSKYAGALVASIRENASPGTRYDIVILNKDVSSANKALFASMVAGHANLSIRFFDVSQYVRDLHLTVHSHFSVETYFRLFIPKIFARYPKVIYLDSDMVTLSDLKALYDVDIGDSLVAAVRDCVMEGMRKFKVRSLRETGSLPAHQYLSEYLGLRRPEDYFQAGLIVFNNEAILKTDYLAAIVAAIKAKDYWYLDQDIMNCILQERVHFLDMRWNTFFGNGDTDTFFENLPKATRDEFFAALMSPHVLHFAGEKKPWSHVGIKYGQQFWRFSRLTPWYEEVLAEASTKFRKSEYSAAPAAQAPFNGLGDTKKKKKSRLKSFVESAKAIGYILAPIGKHRRAKRKKLMSGLRAAKA